MKKVITLAGAVALLIAASDLAPLENRAAAALAHPDLMGSTVSFTDIVESTDGSDPLPLYATPIAVGDSLEFPTSGPFSATSLGGGLPDQTNGELSLTIMTKPGYAIDSIEISETGFTTLDVPFGNGDALARVEAFAVFNVLEVANSPVVVPPDSILLDFLPKSVFQHSVDAAGELSFTEEWTGSGEFDATGVVTKVAITLDNNLFAASLGDGTRAFIDKTDFDIRVKTVRIDDIPEPTGILLMVVGGGIVGLFGMNKGATGE